MGIAEKYILENVSTIPPEVQNIIADLIKVYYKQNSVSSPEKAETDENKQETLLRKQQAYARLQKFQGIIPADFDMKKAKEEAFREKYGSIHNS
jgi:ABC-type nitrate/sulfonate/bicarbonate transport system substrate-binding protein